MESVTVLSPSCQEFAGVRYYLCGKYFQHKGKRLHIAVWEKNFGPVPPGFHVHHIHEDTARNQPWELQAIPKAKHLSMHMTPERRAWSKVNMRKAIEAARAWHATPEGRAWHAANSRAGWESRAPVEAVCQRCGKSYPTHFPTRSKFCSAACKQAALRARRSAQRSVTVR